MKTRIVLLALTIVVLVATGCVGITGNFAGCTPAAVDRHGNMRPDAQFQYLSAKNNAFIDSRTMIDESYGSLAKFGYNEFQTQQMLMSFGFPNSQPALLGTNGLLSGQLSLPFVMPYNRDGSITLFWLPDMQVRFMPMVSVR